MPFIPISYNPSPANEPPTAVISPVNEYIHAGELVTLTGNTSADPEQNTLTYTWEFVNLPAESTLTKFTSVLPDRSVVSFVPDKVGIYQINLFVNDGQLDSPPAHVTFVCRQLPIPHGQGTNPDMRWLFGFIRNWSMMVEDRNRMAIVWSAYTQVLSEVLLRLYEVNLSKSIATIPELIQYRWVMKRLRVDLPESHILTFHIRQGGNDGNISADAVSADAVTLEKPIVVDKDRVLVFDGESRRTISRGTRRVYVNNDGMTIQGTRIALNRGLTSGIKHAIWWMTTGVARFSTTSVATLRCFAGDLLILELTFGNASATISCRIYGVTRDGLIGFEVTPDPLVDSYNYFNDDGSYRASVLNQLEEAFIQMNIDPGRFTYQQIAKRFMDLILTGRVDLIQTELSITMSPKHVLRLSRYSVDDDTVSIPYLQSSIQNPVFILKENEDYVLREDELGKYVQLADTVILSESNLPRAFWAEVVFVDNASVIENNFGVLVGGEREKLPDRVTDYTHYRGAVSGLMYAFATGPTPDNIRLGVQIVLGLPFTEERSIIRLIDSQYTESEGLIITEDLDQDGRPTGFQRLHRFPAAATLETNPDTGQTIKVEDSLPRFFPLCSGVLVLDWVNTPEWWFPLYDGQAKMPQFHEAFFDLGWYPAEGKEFPTAALQNFQEEQKVHTFEVRLDPNVFDVNDILFADQFVKGVQKTWRLGLEKKGIRPHYTYPLIIVRQDIVEQLNILDRVRIEPTYVPIDDIAGYETALRQDHNTSLGLPAIYQDAPMRASRVTSPFVGNFVAPVVDSVTAGGAVRVEVVRYSGTAFQVGENVSNGSILAEVLAIEVWPAIPGLPQIESLLLDYVVDGDLYGPTDILTGQASAATAAIINESAIELSTSEDFIQNNYHIVRHRDILYVSGQTAIDGRFGVFSIHPTDDSRLLLYQLRSDDPTHPPQFPHGISNPNGNSSYRPSLDTDRVAWQVDVTDYQCIVERPYHNPIHSPELYLQDPALSRLTFTAAGAGFHSPTMANHMHSDGIKAGQKVVLFDNNTATVRHLAECEISRETDGNGEIASSDLAAWQPAAVSPSLYLGGDSITSESFHMEVYDPRLPYPKVIINEQLPDQTGMSDFQVKLPATANFADDFYKYMYLRARTGAGAFLSGGTVKGHWKIVGYDGTTKVATLHLSHGGIFDSTTFVDVLSLHSDAHAIVMSQLRHKFPGHQLQIQTWNAVKAGDTLGGAPTCTLRTTDTSPTLTSVNIANIRPNGKDFTTANAGADLPFVAGIVQAGDIVVLSPTGASAADKKAASIPYTVLGNISATSFDVSPTPTVTSTTGGLHFTIYRASPTIVTDVTYP